MSSPALQLQNVNLTLRGPAGNIEILKEISLEVPTGQSISIVGPSGSGKTSLLMVIAGLESATSGTVTIAGQNITNFNEDALALFRREHIGIIFQSFHLIPTMTAMENVTTPLELSGVDDAWDRAKTALENVGLAHRTMHYPAQLSGGEQQRVALARAMVTRPSVLLADEPTGNLDGENGEHIMQLLFKLQEESNTTLLLITHDPTLAKACQRHVEMRDGRITDSNILKTYK